MRDLDEQEKWILLCALESVRDQFDERTIDELKRDIGDS